MSPAVPAAIDAATPNTETRRPLRVAICGEVCSGKSALVNGLLRNAALPDFFGEPSRPEVRIETGGTEGWTGIYADGRTVALDPKEPVPLQDGIVQLVIQTGDQAPHLDGIELVELPPLYDEHITEREIARVGQFDVLIWATIGSQAWRLSEKTILENLGEARPKRALLAITRADKFRKAADRRKVFERVEKNAAEIFDRVLLTSASANKVKASTKSDKAWEETGLAEIYRWILAQMDATDEPAPGIEGEIVALSDYRDPPEQDPHTDVDAEETAVHDDQVETVEADAGRDVAEVNAAATPDPAPASDGVMFKSSARLNTEPETEMTTAPEPVGQAEPEALAEPAPEPEEPKADTRIHVLATLRPGNQEADDIRIGDEESAQKYVTLAHRIAEKALKAPAYEGLEIYDLGFCGSHVLFGPTGNNDEVMVLVSKAAALPRGAARALFLQERAAL